MMKILLADDFALLREDLCETLGAQPDMEVVGAAESGAQVQEMAQKLDFDVLLIDIEMENTQAFTRLKTFSPKSRMPSSFS